MADCVDHGKQGCAKMGYAGCMYLGRKEQMHRAVYCEANGVAIKSIKGKVVRHTCDNPRCINPTHLLLGTTADNMRDKVARGRQTRGTDQAAARLTEDAVRSIRSRYKAYCKTNGSVALAREFGVTSSTITKVAGGQSWQHI